MKVLRKLLLASVVLLISAVLLLNANVTTKQCINYKCRSIRIPLYLKILDFFDRHYHYKVLVREITIGAKTEEERAKKIFAWTYQNIRKLPYGFPIIDDHAWYIIIRGYGVTDQACDVFSTLCNYAGLDAFFTSIYADGRKQSIPFSLVSIGKKWFVFDPYMGVYFTDPKGNLADIATLKSGNWELKSLSLIPQNNTPNYKIFIKNLPEIKEIRLCRSSIQSPLNRLLFELKKKMR